MGLISHYLRGDLTASVCVSSSLWYPIYLSSRLLWTVEAPPELDFRRSFCNRWRSWTFLLRVIGPQLPKQCRFRHFQLPSIFPPRVHAVITRWSRSPPQCMTNQQKGVTSTFPPNQSANRVMFSANQYLTCKAVFMCPHSKFHRSN